jgi:hypothetical protein
MPLLIAAQTMCVLLSGGSNAGFSVHVETASLVKLCVSSMKEFGSEVLYKSGSI